jgi:hypothetical protein
MSGQDASNRKTKRCDARRRLSAGKTLTRISA